MADEGHQWLTHGDGYDLYCHDEDRACFIRHGYDFDYCPYCGEEIDNPAEESQN